MPIADSDHPESLLAVGILIPDELGSPFGDSFSFSPRSIVRLGCSISVVIGARTCDPSRMSTARIFDFTTDNFQTKVLEANRPVLVFFWAVWNSPSRGMQSDVEKLADKYVDNLKVGKVDVEQNEPIASTYNATSVPTCLLFKGGVVVAKASGDMSYSQLENLVKPHL